MKSSDIAIQVVTAANASVLDCIDNDVFDHEVQPALLHAFLANPANLLVVAVVDGEVVGMASGIAYLHPDKPLQLFINEVGVSARFQRQGVGKELVGVLLQHAKTIGCREAWVATEVSNTAARALYSTLGAEEVGEQAVVYTYRLTDE